MARKRPIHTTLSVEAYRIIERFEHELGGKNEVLEKALHTLKTNRTVIDSNPAKHSYKKKIPTGIKGLDNMLSGGIKDKDIYSLTGIPGTGKSTMALQYLLGDPKDSKGILFCDTHIDNILEQAYEMGKIKQLEEALDNKTIHIEDEFNKDMADAITIIEELSHNKPTNRIVLDSVNTTIRDFYNDIKLNPYAWYPFRKLVNGKQSVTTTQNTTALIVNEITSHNNTNELPIYCNGNILLYTQQNTDTQEREYFLDLIKSGNAAPNYSGPRQVTYTANGLSIAEKLYHESKHPTDIEINSPISTNPFPIDTEN